VSWREIKLGDIGEFKAGYGFPHKYQGNSTGKIPFAKVGDISTVARSGEKYILEARHFISRSDLTEIKAKTVPINTILFAKIGEAIKQNFRAITACEMVIDNNSMGLVPDAKLVDVNYLYHFMCKLDLYQFTGATTVPAIRKSVLEELKIPLPPLEQQKRIAAILDKADAIRRKRQQAIQLADDFLRSVFLEMFGDPVNNPKGFATGTIRDFVETAKYGSSGKASETEGEYPMLRMGNITYKGNWDFKKLKYIDLDEKDKDKYLAKKGDLLFNRTNSKELVGKTAVFEEDKPMALAGYLVRVRPNERGNNYYLSGYLNSSHGKKTLMGMCKSIVGMANINAQELQNIKITLPPIALQNRFEQIVKDVNCKVKKYDNSQNCLGDLFNSLSQKAFAGEL
jgi:type I restriction enzyme S subunit